MRNGLGVVGVAAEKARMYIYNIFGPNAFFFMSDLEDAWKYCIAELDRLKSSISPDFKMVVSMSVGGNGDPLPAIETSPQAMLYARGDILFVAAAGNDGTGNVSYPAGYSSSIISVAATDLSNAPADFSQYNADVELAAPGVNTLSTLSTALAGTKQTSTLVTSPPVYGNATDDNLSSPPPQVLELSGLGTASGGTGLAPHLIC